MSASDNGAKKILVIEKASKKERGGNSRYTNGAFRFAYKGYSDLKKIIPTLKNSNSIDYGKIHHGRFHERYEKSYEWKDRQIFI